MMLVFFILGCGSRDQPESSGRVMAAELGGTDACDFGLLAWNLGAVGQTYTCAGGVEYQIFNSPCPHDFPAGDPTYCPEVDVANSHDEPNSCNWADGTNGFVHIHDPIPTKKVLVCCDPELGWCPKPLCHYDYIPTTTCDAMVEQKVTGLRGGYFNGLRYQQPYNWGTYVYAFNKTTDNVYCTYDLGHYPENFRWNAPNATHCGTHKVDDPPTPTWPKCTTLNSDGTCKSCLAYVDDQSCGETVHHLAFGKNFSELEGVHNVDSPKNACLTDENFSIDDSAPATNVNLKYGRLTGRLDLAVANQIADLDNTALVEKIVEEIKLLFEMYGDHLDPLKQASAVKLYFDYPDAGSTPSCGKIFSPPDTSRCMLDPKTIQNVNATLAFCARMLSGHVSPRIRDIDLVKYTCIDAAKIVASLRPSLFAAGGADDGTSLALPDPTTTDAGTDAATDGATDAGTSSDRVLDAHDVCAFKTYRADYDALVTVPLGARFAGPRDPRSDADKPELQMRLYLMNRWYEAIGEMYPYVSAEPNAKSVQKAAWTHAQEMEASFWRGIYRNLFPQAPVEASGGSTLDAGTVLDSGVPDGASPAPSTFNADSLAALTRDTLKADHNLLLLAFSPYTPGNDTPDPDAKPPLRTAPLLMVVADALEGMSQRMKDVGIYHDMGCAYVGCAKGVDSEIAHLVELLSKLADPSPDGLPTALSVAHHVKDALGQPLVRPDWLEVYDALLLQHGTLESALANALGAGVDWSYPPLERFLENGGEQGMPDPAKHLASIVQGMRAAYATYKLTGLFNPSARNRLAAGIQQDEIEALRNDVNTRAAKLQAAIDNYSSNLSSIANSVIQEMGLKAAAVRSTHEIDQKRLKIHELAHDFAGLSNSLEVNEKGFGSFAQSYANVTQFSDVLLNGDTYGPYLIDGRSAKAVGPLANGAAVSGVAAATIQDLGKGTIVSVLVGPGDKWSPTCALHYAKFPDPTAPKDLEVTSTMPTGPEGYIVSYSDGAYTASKNETAWSESATLEANMTVKTCNGTKASVGFDLFGNGLQVYNDTSVCLSAGITGRVGVSGTQGNSDGSEMRTSANFASGVRLKTTPFPGAPVGALLAVVTPKGHPEFVRELRVVQEPATTIILSEDSDLYLVPNDLWCAEADGTYKLSVTVNTAKHASDALKWVNDGIAKVAQTIHKMGGEDGDTSGDGTSGTVNIVSQGRMTPAQAASIRAQAMLELVAVCKTETTPPTAALDPGSSEILLAGDTETATSTAWCDPSLLPESVRNFITAFIDREIERIELKLEMLAVRRQFQSLALDVAQIIDDYNASMEQGRVAELLPRWTLRNLDSELLRAETSQLVDAVTYDLYPVLLLRYSPILASIANDLVLNPALMTLVNAKWDAPVADLANAAAAAATHLYNTTERIKERYPSIEPKFVALSFPRPGKKATTWLHTDGTGVWQAATTGNHVASFQILPEHLYRMAGGPATLLCQEEVPVIRDLAVILAGGTIDSNAEGKLNPRSFSLYSYSATKLFFPTAAVFDSNHNVYSEGGPLEFEIKSDWTSLDTLVLAAADVSTVKTKYDAARSDPTKSMNARGLSPFTSFTIDFSALYDPAYGLGTSPVDLADQIVLAMMVEYRKVAPDRTMRWISTCQ